MVSDDKQAEIMAEIAGIIVLFHSHVQTSQ
jgi:hypothetical protein